MNPTPEMIEAARARLIDGGIIVETDTFTPQDFEDLVLAAFESWDTFR